MPLWFSYGAKAQFSLAALNYLASNKVEKIKQTNHQVSRVNTFFLCRVFAHIRDMLMQHYGQ